MKKNILCLCGLLFNGLVLCAQQLPLKQFNVATPEAAMLGKFENITVSNYSGVPDISIPLYTIKERELEIPIVIRYNSSGIQVDEEATWVGLGWNLSVGGQITHIPIGAEDDFETTNWSWIGNGYNQLMNGYMPGEKNYTGRAERGWVWAECVPAPQGIEDYYQTFYAVKNFQFANPDAYSYQLPTASGKFFLKPITHVPTLYGAIKSIESIIKESNRWTIYDMNGIKYLFNSSDREISQNMSIDNTTVPFSSATWRMSSILLPSGKTVDFQYDDGVSLKTSQSDNFQTFDRIVYFNYSNSYMYRHAAKYLSKIETEKEKIIFELSAERTDLKSSDYPYDQNKSPKRLSAIHIIDKITNKTIKTYRFTYDYIESEHTAQTDVYNYKRLRLLSIKEVGYTSSGTEVTNSPYVFEYNSTLLPVKGSKAVDHWGYYNGRNNNQIYLPDLSSFVFSGFIDLSKYPIDVINMIKDKQVMTGNNNYSTKAIRGMDPVSAQAGVLTKIKYPTGGYRVLNYEANTFTNYPVYSAAEEEGFINTCTSVNVVDLNKPTCTSTPIISNYFFPDPEGYLQFLDINLSISRIDNSITYNDMKDSYVKIVKEDQYGVKTDIVVLALLGKMDEFNNNNGKVTLNHGYLKYLGGLTDRYYAVAYLPDIPILTPVYCTSLKAQASGGFILLDPSITKNISIGGGLRIASQEAYIADGIRSSKTIYNYSNTDGTSSGKMMTPLGYISYHDVIEKTAYGTNNVSTKYTYSFSMASNSYTPVAYDASGAIVGYSRVEVTEVDNTDNPNFGKSAYYYKNIPSVFVGNGFNTPNLPYYNNGLVDSIVFFNNSGLRVKKVINSYQSIKNELTYSANVSDNYIGPDRCASYDPVFPALYNPFAYQGRWQVLYYPIQSVMFVQSKATVIDYSPGSENSLITDKLMEYNTDGQLTILTKTQSNGSISQTRFRYPSDISTGNYSSMMNLNMRNFQIEKTDLLNSNVINSELTTYRANGGTFVPDQVFKLETNTPLSGINYFNGVTKDSHYGQIPSVNYDSYDDHGNLLQYQKAKDPKNSDTWGYNNTYLISETKNSPTTECGYTGFEDSGYNGWYASSSMAITSSDLIKTGRTSVFLYDETGLSKSFDVGKNAQNHSGYKASVWVKKGIDIGFIEIGIVGQTPTRKYNTGEVNEWHLLEVELPQVKLEGYINDNLKIKVKIGSTSGNGAYFDDLRFYPMDAQMTTYTYDPLIGVTSVSDINNKPSIYKYDAFNRLWYVTDYLGNILKKYEYNYKTP